MALMGLLAALLVPRLGTAEPQPLTLENVVSLARSQSPSMISARHRLRGSFWQYQMSLANYRPSLSLEATAPSVTRSISRYSLADGTDAFVRRSVANSAASVQLSKNIAWTGGQIFFSSGLQRIDVMGKNGETQFLSTPATIGFRQPLFAFNPARWQKRIEPLRFAESQQQFLEDLEGISVSATTAFFDLLSAQTRLDAARSNQASSDTLLLLARSRPGAEPADENELLQLELASLNARAEATRAQFDLEIKRQRLMSYLGLGSQDPVTLVTTGRTPHVQVDVDRAITEARRNRAASRSYDRQLLESDREVAEAQDAGAVTSLTASYGLSRSTANPSLIFRDPEQQQEATIGIQIPLLDWGRAKARRELAQSSEEVTRATVAQARVDLDRDVTLQVLEFNIQEEQLRIAARADSVADRRYWVALDAYVRGKQTVDALQLAQREKTEARKAYVDELRAFWTQYYELRRATLFDFDKNEAISIDSAIWE